MKIIGGPHDGADYDIKTGKLTGGTSLQPSGVYDVVFVNGKEVLRFCGAASHSLLSEQMRELLTDDHSAKS